MNVVHIKLLKPHYWGKRGEVVEVSEDQARQMVSSEYAEIVDSPPKAKKLKGSDLRNKSMSAAG